MQLEFVVYSYGPAADLGARWTIPVAPAHEPGCASSVRGHRCDCDAAQDLGAVVTPSAVVARLAGVCP